MPKTKKSTNSVLNMQQEHEVSQTRSRFYLGISILLFILAVGAGFSVWQIRQAKANVEKANQQRDHLFSMVAHDLRSPVANLQHIASTIKYVSNKKDPKATEALMNAVEESSILLYKLVDNLLQWSLIQQRSTFYRPSTFAIVPQIEDIIELFRSRLTLKDIEVEYAQKPNPTLVTDRMTFQTIVRNLLDNAIKFSPSNSQISIKIVETPATIEVRITDKGSGIPADVQSILFDNNAFEKSRLGTEGEKGTGIGLYVCQELAKMNKAEIKLLATSLEGTTFALIYFQQQQT
jgi:K+-sensing histidine kinase KdpD